MVGYIVLTLAVIFLIPVIEKSLALFQRYQFVQHATHVTATVQHIRAESHRCGKRKHCTEYTAVLNFSLNNKEHTIKFNAGMAVGKNQSIKQADYVKEQKIALLINPNNLDEVYEDTFSGVWASPIQEMMLSFILTILFGVISFYILRTPPPPSTDSE